MRNFFRKRLNKKGFTLVELLIVIAVLGIIAGIGINSMGGLTDNIKVKADTENAKMMVNAIETRILAGVITGVADGASPTLAQLNADTDVLAILASAQVQSKASSTYTITAFTVDTNNADLASITITFGDETFTDTINSKEIR